MDEGPYAFLVSQWHDAVTELSAAYERLKQLDEREPDFKDDAYLEWQDEKSRALRGVEKALRLYSKRWKEYAEGRGWDQKIKTERKKLTPPSTPEGR